MLAPSPGNPTKPGNFKPDYDSPLIVLTSQDHQMGTTLRETTVGRVRRITLTRADEYNTITPALRDELSDAIDTAEHDSSIGVLLLDAEGPAFCAGYGLDWATVAQAEERDLTDSPTTTTAEKRVWDSVSDQHLIGSFAKVWAKLHDCSKPTIAAVQGWCIAGGTNVVFNAHLIVAAQNARFGYPPSRVWGIPEAPWNWVMRMGLQNARRYMLTGDEFTAAQALEMGAILEVVPDDELHDRALALAQRVAQVPNSQLEMITWSLNAVADEMYDPKSSRRLGTLYDGVARHTQEGLDFVARSQAVGFREAVRERDRPFGDYGERSSATPPS